MDVGQAARSTNLTRENTPLSRGTTNIPGNSARVVAVVSLHVPSCKGAAVLGSALQFMYNFDASASLGEQKSVDDG